MKKEPDYTTVEKLVDSTALKIIGRVSAPLMVALCIWVLKSINETNLNVATLTVVVQGKVETLTASVENARNLIQQEKDNRDRLEGRFNSFIDAFASEGRQSKSGNGI